jgi:hypothetical protein
VTEETERPTTQVLLVQLGAQLAFDPRLVALGALFAALRVVARLAAAQALRVGGGAGPAGAWLGAGMLHAGGAAAAMALSFAAPSRRAPRRCSGPSRSRWCWATSWAAPASRRCCAARASSR